MAVLVILAGILIAIITRDIVNLTIYYKKARTIGFPVIVTPVEPFQPLWALVLPLLAPILRRLPYGLGEFVDYGSFNWYFQTKNRIHRDLGPAIIVVNPGGLKIMLADGLASEDIMYRYREFIKPPFIYTALDVFGKNVDSVNKDEWQRHRKITAPSFNERNSSIVWAESLHQSSGLLSRWTSTVGLEISSTHNDSLTLALNVILGAGFGKSSDFDSVTSPGPGHLLSFKQSLHTILQKFIAVIFAASLTSKLDFLIPDKYNTVGIAIREFKQYLVEMVAEERASLTAGNPEKHTLVSALMRASDLEEIQGKGKNTLSVEEIYGNLFMFSFAGHDTTANTLSYALILLAANEKALSWMKEEISAVVGGSDPEDWEYEKIFPQLKRCLAVMFETVRLYGPVVTLPRITENSHTPLSIQGKEYNLPPNTLLMMNYLGAHTDSSFWGKDAWEWRPERWLLHKDGLTGMENEELLQPPSGTFFPWASSPRVCPGKKFSQVEFVAVMARVMRDHRIKIAPLKGESREKLQKRVRETIADSSVTLTLGMNHKERVNFIWEKDL